MTEEDAQARLEAQIEAERVAEGYEGMNNFRGYLPGGYRYEALQKMPDFGNDKSPDKLKGLSLREFTQYVVEVGINEGVDPDRIRQLQEEYKTQGTKQTRDALNGYIFRAYKALRLEGFSHDDCAG